MAFGSSTMFITGFIMAWPSEKIPDGFLPCNGAEISRTTYKNLFDVIGTKYGQGDGSTTFNLPNAIFPIGTTAPVIGNGMVMGITDGSTNYGMNGSSIAAYNGSTTSYGQNLPFNGGNGDLGIATKALGLTTDPTKSGLIVDLTQATAATTAIIKY